MFHTNQIGSFSTVGVVDEDRRDILHLRTTKEEHDHILDVVEASGGFGRTSIQLERSMFTGGQGSLAAPMTYKGNLRSQHFTSTNDEVSR